MSLVFLYANRSGTYSVDLGTQAVRLGSVALTQSAEHGDIGSCQLAIDDLDGTAGHSSDQILPYHTLDVIEGDAPVGNRLVYAGYTMARNYESDDSLITGEAVRITIDLADMNHAAHDPVLRGSDANRSAETVGARLTWLIASAYSFFLDLGLVVYPTTLMDAADYRNQTSDSVLDDCAQQVGYNWFLYKDETAPVGGQTGLFFDDANSSTAYTSDLRLSNVLSEVDSNLRDGVGATQTWAPIHPRLGRNPATMASGIVLPYAAGAAYVTRAATTAEIGHVDVTAADANVKTATSAARRANRLLWEASTEEDVISTAVELPSANVNDIRAGQRMSARFRQLPDYKDFSWFRVLRRTVNQAALTDKLFRVDLELSPVEGAQPVPMIVQSVFGGNVVDTPLPYDVTPGNVIVVVEDVWKSTGGATPVAPYTGPIYPELGGDNAWTDLLPGFVHSAASGDRHTIGAYAKLATTSERHCRIDVASASHFGIYEVANTSPSGISVISSTDYESAATDLDVGDLSATAAGQIALLVVGQYTTDGARTLTLSAGWSSDDSFSNPGFGDSRPFVMAHTASSTAETIEAQVTASNSFPWCGLAILLPPP